MKKFNHMIDLAFEIDSDLDEGEVFKIQNLPELLNAARQRLDNIEQSRDMEAFGYCDSYENDDSGVTEAIHRPDLRRR